MRIWILVAALGLFPPGSEKTRAAEMRSHGGCSLVETEWADGDSFQVKFPDGEKHTVRLYGVDCIEAQIDGETDARRLRSQRRYFGISNYQESALTSTEMAKQYGKKAALRVRQLLANRKFTVHTAFADARGDGRYPRIYGYVEMPGGQDLGEQLVATGLARAFGVKRGRPGVMSGEDYMERLRDLELQAAKKGLGIWKYTDWESLPAERKQQRDEDAELAAAIDAKVELTEASVDLNTASRDLLMRLPGIGEKSANRIIEGRDLGPYKRPEDLARVHRIGLGTIDKIRRYLKFDQPAEAHE